MKKKVGGLIPLNIQFFAESENSNNLEGENSEEKNDVNVDKSEQKKEEKKEEKLFTQKQVSAMMAKEKREGKNAILSALGFKDEDEAKKAVSLLNALLDSQKTESEKNDDKNKKIQDEKKDAENRATLAESKLECLTNGVDKDSIDDVLAIAMPKVTEENTLGNVLKEMKNNKRYSMFFNSYNDGTGTPPGHSKNENGERIGIGKRLGESTKNTVKKSSYF